MKYLIFLLFNLFPLSLEKEPEQNIAVVRIFISNGNVFIQTQYDGSIYKSPCEVMYHLLEEAKLHCVDSIDTKPENKPKKV